MFLSLEPMGSVGPKITTGEDFKHIKGKSGHSLNMLCPAQAYPTPFFRYWLNIKKFYFPSYSHKFGQFSLRMCISLCLM